MKIGVDASVFRETPTGIYNYVDNLVCSFENDYPRYDISLVLYGPRGAEDRDFLRDLRHRFPRTKLVNAWDGLPLTVLHRQALHGATRDVPVVRSIDAAIVRLWKTLHTRHAYLTRRSVEALAAFGRRADYDVFHHTFGLTFPLQPKANVLTIYDLIPRLFADRYPGALEWFSESFEAANDVDVVVAISENTKQDLMEHLKVPADRIHVTHLAAHEQYRPISDGDAIRSVLARYGIGDRPYILTLGTLEHRRNIHRLLEAFYLLKQEGRGFEHQLILAGARGEASEIIFETLARLKLEGDVTWLGHVRFADLPFLLNGADVFVYPSLYEGFGLPPLEAMACGTPVASSCASSLPEVVGDAGLLFDPEDVSDIARAIQSVLRSDELKRTLRQKGLTRAKQFTWKRTAELTIQ